MQNVGKLCCVNTVSFSSAINGTQKLWCDKCIFFIISQHPKCSCRRFINKKMGNCSSAGWDFLQTNSHNGIGELLPKSGIKQIPSPPASSSNENLFSLGKWRGPPIPKWDKFAAPANSPWNYREFSNAILFPTNHRDAAAPRLLMFFCW